MPIHDLYIGENARYQVKRSWCSVTSKASGDIADIDLAVEIDLPEGSMLRPCRIINSNNQIVIALRVVPAKNKNTASMLTLPNKEKKDEQQAKEYPQEVQEERRTHEETP